MGKTESPFALKRACHETARDQNVSVANRFRLIQVLERWIIRSVNISAKCGFRYVKIPFETGLIVFVRANTVRLQPFCISPLYAHAFCLILE